MEEYRRWEDNIKMDLKEIGVSVRSWIDSTQDRVYWRALVNALLNLQVQQTIELNIYPQTFMCCELHSLLSKQRVEIKHEERETERGR